MPAWIRWQLLRHGVSEPRGPGAMVFTKIPKEDWNAVLDRIRRLPPLVQRPLIQKLWQAVVQMEKQRWK